MNFTRLGQEMLTSKSCVDVKKFRLREEHASGYFTKTKTLAFECF